MASFLNLIVHVTVSGWHSREENTLRLDEFERYHTLIPRSYLRVVNRSDWHSPQLSEATDDSTACCEEWLLKEIARRGLIANVIRTPYHSVHPFPGSRIGMLGSRHMAGIEYSNQWSRFIGQVHGECCTTGKCKTCPTNCGAIRNERRQPDPLLAARALEAMHQFEVARQLEDGRTPLGLYTARLLARKTIQAYKMVGRQDRIQSIVAVSEELDYRIAALPLTKQERRYLVNDSHALVVDGMDRHHLWRTASRSKKGMVC